jgi:hypothetical protein
LLYLQNKKNLMKTVVISAEDDKVAKLLTSLAKKMGLKSFVLSDQKKEDIAFIHAINEGMKTEKLPLQSSYDILDNLLR